MCGVTVICSKTRCAPCLEGHPQDLQLGTVGSQEGTEEMPFSPASTLNSRVQGRYLGGRKMPMRKCGDQKKINKEIAALGNYDSI